MVIVQENTFVWNTGGLRADLGLVRDGGWDRLDDEARKERQASQGKIEWLRTHITLSEPTVVFLEEVTGSLGDARTGLRRTFTRLGYATLMLPGAGGGAGTELSRANGIFAAVRRDSASFVGGACRVASRCLGVQIKHTLEPGKAVRNYVCTCTATGFTRSLRRMPANASSHSCGARWTGWSSEAGGCCWATSTEWCAASGGSGAA